MRLRLVVERENPLGEGEKGLAFRRHDYTPCAAAEEGAVEDIFQSAKLLADRGLGAPQGLGGARPLLPARTAVTKQRKAAVSTSRAIRQSYEISGRITSSLVWPDRIALLR